MKKTLITAMMLLSSFAMYAEEIDDYGIFNHIGVGVEVGTCGIGIDVAAPIGNHFQVRAGYSFIPTIKIKNNEVNISSNKDQWNEIMTKAGQFSAYDQKVKTFYEQYGNTSYPDNLLVDGKLSGGNFDLLFDFFPSENSGFHVTAGFYVGPDKFIEAYTTNCEGPLGAIKYYNDNLANKTITNGLGSYTFGDKIGAKLGDYLIEPSVDEKGNGYANAELKVNSFRPYLGIGFGRAVPKKRVGVSVDLGVQFWGSPKIYVGGQKIDENSNINGDGGLIKTLSKIIVYPCLNFRINGRIF